MSHELVRALRPVYDDIDSAESGLPSRALSGEVWRSLQPRGQALFITALGTAARALIYPQVAPGAVERCVKAIEATRPLLGAKHAGLPAEVDALLHPAQSATLSNPEQLQAQHCLGHALAFCLTSASARFTPLIDAFAVSQRAEYTSAVRAKHCWIGWLDDVVSRSDRFDVPALLDLLEQTARGTLSGIPGAFRWEGAAEGAGKLEVWTEEPKSRRLLQSVMACEPLQVQQRKLIARIAPQPAGVGDILRIEYFVEHVIHRRFLNAAHYGTYDQIDYLCPGNGQSWVAPS